MSRLIALDPSSRNLGYALFEDDRLRFAGSFGLNGTIGQRCLAAYTYTVGLLDAWQGTDTIAVESPAGSFLKGLLPQTYVRGSIMLAAAQRGLEVVDVSPTAAKRCLTGGGKAEKQEMLVHALDRLGIGAADIPYCYRKKNGTLWAELNGLQILSEHGADAVGVGLLLTSDTPSIHSQMH